MKNFNLLSMVTIATLIAICSAASAEPQESASSLETPVRDAATSALETEPTSSNTTDPEDYKITEETAIPPTTIAVESISDIEYTCEHNTSKRIIRVFKNTAAGLACKVTYEKDTGAQTLWTARNDQEYCTQKAAEFTAKQAGWGWLCFNQDGEIVSAPLEESAEHAPIIEAPTAETPAIETEPATTETAETETVEENMEVDAPLND